MTTAIVWIGMGILVLLAVLVLLLGLMLRQNLRERAAARRDRVSQEPQEARDTEHTPRPAPQSEPERQQLAALPVDPENPPSWRTYQPHPGRPRRACTCHPDRPLADGQRVMWWPVPDSGGGVHVFCEDGIDEHPEEAR